MESKGSEKRRPHQSTDDQDRQRSKPYEPVSGSETGGFGPEMMLGLWTSWMEANSRSAQEWTDQDKPAWGVIHADELGKILASEARQLNEGLQKDPLLGLHRPDVERQPVSRGHPARLGGNSRFPSQCLAPLAA